MGFKKKRSLAFIAITTTGFVATIAQIIILREFLVVFYGNELSAGIIFAGWLLWNAIGSGVSIRWSATLPPHRSSLGLLLTLLAVMMPVCVLIVRASAVIGVAPVGEMIPFGKMLMLSFAITGLFCPFSGALFGLCWAYQRTKGQGTPSSQPITIYLGEALGAAVGGLVFYFVFLYGLSTLSAVWITSAGLLIIAGGLIRPWRHVTQSYTAGILWLAAAVVVFTGIVAGAGIEKMSRRWQWGKDYTVVYDTPFQNIAVVRKKSQISVFSNGLWLFSAPDRLSAENAVHLTLLQHSRPQKILLLGGGSAGHLAEIFKYPGIKRVDYIEPDPAFITRVEPYLPPVVRASLHHPGVRIINEDAANFIRQCREKYDVILMNNGDPMNAQMNRFYTLEFFLKVHSCLNRDGIFSFSISGAEDMLGPVQTLFLKSFETTLRQVFSEVRLFPGDHARFFAAPRKDVLFSGADEFIARIAEKKLQLSYVRPDALRDALNPFRLDYYRSILSEIRDKRVNRDYRPTCYYHNMTIWAIQWHPLLRRILEWAAQVKLSRLWITVGVMGIGALAFWWRSGTTAAAVAGSVLLTGAVGMVLQMVLLLGFQIVQGFFYLQLSLIIAFFMAGLAAGSGLIAWWQTDRLPKRFYSRRSLRPVFIRVQLGVCLLPLGMAAWFFVLQRGFGGFLSPPVMGWLFSVISLVAGTVAGVHFSLAVLMMRQAGVAVRNIGGGLYAIDLAGAAGGVLLATFYILPVYGLMTTLFLLSAVSFVSLLTLMRPPE